MSAKKPMTSESLIKGLYKRIGNLMRRANAFEKEAVMYKAMFKERVYAARRMQGDMDRIEKERDEAYRTIDELKYAKKI